MSKFHSVVVCLCFVAGSSCPGQNMIERANQLELQGKFNQCASELATALNKDMPENKRRELEFELDRLERIKKDFPYTKEQLFVELQGAVKDLSKSEFESWIAENRF